MCFIVIPLFYAGSQFSFDPLYASTVSGTGAPQRLLLRHCRCSAAALELSSVDSGRPESFTQTGPSSLAVAGMLWLLGGRIMAPRTKLTKSRDRLK